MSGERVHPSRRGLREDLGWEAILLPALPFPAGSAPGSPNEELNYRPGVSADSFCLSTLLFCPQMNSLPAERIQEIQKAIELFSVGQGPAKTLEEASKRSYQFWDTQPVPKLGTYSLSPFRAPWEKPCGPQAAQRSPEKLVSGQQASPWMAPHCCPVWASKASMTLVHRSASWTELIITALLLESCAGTWRG